MLALYKSVAPTPSQVSSAATTLSPLFNFNFNFTTTTTSELDAAAGGAITLNMLNAHNQSSF